MWGLVAGMFLLIACHQGASSESELRLSLPVAFEIGIACNIQNYVDQDPGPGARDYTCGRLTYDGHKGIDFRLPDVSAGLTVT